MSGPGEKFTEDETKQILLAVIAAGGNCAAGVRALGDHENPLFPNVSTVRVWVNKTHKMEYQRLRDEYGQELEQTIADSMRFVAGAAAEVQLLALAAAKKRLEENNDAEPAKTASFAARAGGTAVEKLMTLTNRPERITEQRDINQTLRSLVGRGVLKMIPGGEPETVDGTVEDDAA